MPENLERFEAEDTAFTFSLKGMPEIRLVLKEKIANSQIVLGAASSKLPFTLTTNLNKISENSSEVQMLFEGEFNPMMTMMIKSPLQKFINTLSDNIEKL